KVIPQEEVFDRIFHDGVCQLSYDPFARLALTIQYYCGTRVTETCELHLFCLLEDQHGHAYLLIPRGKTKQERPFPIVAVGMEHLLEYMDQVVSLRLSSDGTSRTLGQTNFRYLIEDPERAHDWHYLFDRVPIAEGHRKKTRGRLSAIRVSQALQEALLFAAKRNADGLFQPGTYSPICQQRRLKGKECRYFVTEEGITTCPRCGSRLAGHRGGYCHHILEEDFVCDGVGQAEEVFCPKCDAPLASFVVLSTHLFRHNSVSRTHNAGVSLVQNMRLHGHQTIPMHLRYVHLYLDETTQEVRHLFAEKCLQEVSQALELTQMERQEDQLVLHVTSTSPMASDASLKPPLSHSVHYKTEQAQVSPGWWSMARGKRFSCCNPEPTFPAHGRTNATGQRVCSTTNSRQPVTTYQDSSTMRSSLSVSPQLARNSG
ncbi:MAG TPA: hypothetical protein VGN34_15820, partial [Ktedonobacteraceae bacterium]